MRISTVELRHVRVPFKGPFQHARAGRARADAVIVTLRSDAGRAGYGEIVPRPYVTGESIEDVLSRTGPRMADRLCGTSFSSQEEAVKWCREGPDVSELALFGGFELALLDLAGRTFGFSVGELVGPEPLAELPRGVVIGFETETARLPRHCAMLRLAGHRHIKVKVGRADDRERLEVIAAASESYVPTTVRIATSWPKPAVLSMSIELPDLSEISAPFDVMLAITESGLSIDVESGENAGRRLSHVGVVRHLKSLGTVSPSAEQFETTKRVPIDPGWSRERLRAVIFLQVRDQGRILGAATARLSPRTTPER